MSGFFDAAYSLILSDDVQLGSECQVILMSQEVMVRIIYQIEKTWLN